MATFEDKLMEGLDTDFEVGDRVIFETSKSQNNLPRWAYNDDMGGSAMWADGVVEYVDERVVQVKYNLNDWGYLGDAFCNWPNRLHPDYDPLQWIQPGYLQMVLKKKRCECGAERVNGPITGHSYYCPKYKE